MKFKVEMKLFYIPVAFAAAAILTCAHAASELANGTCILPSPPPKGEYKVNGINNPDPATAYDNVVLNYTCNPGYTLLGNSVRLCIRGVWSEDEPKCVLLNVHPSNSCKLDKHSGVEYTCHTSRAALRVGVPAASRSLTELVRAVCRAPNYYYSGPLQNMRCISGRWDYVATCIPECGTIAPASSLLLTSTRRGELPWHAFVYKKTTKPYMQLCGATLVSNNVVLTAAHCVWDSINNKPIEAQDIAVAVGKLYRPWDDHKDEQYAQKSDVSAIKIPPRFQGVLTNYQDDISVLILANEITFNINVRPVCMNFDMIFERHQLKAGKFGKIASFGAPGEPSKDLKVIEMSYVPIQECLSNSPPDFKIFITSDKFCSGFENGTGLCRGDSGGGISYPELDKGITRYYLRGIASTSPRVHDEQCIGYPVNTLFTQISKHEHFINEFI